MIRTLITILVPFCTPFVVYAIWWWAARRRELAEASGKSLPGWYELPWFWLVTTGAVLTALTFVGIGVLGLDGTEGTYVPPRFEDGRIVPGRISE